MSVIAVIVSPGTWTVSLGAMMDLHARLGEFFETHAVLADYSRLFTQLALAPVVPGPVRLAGGYPLPCNAGFASLEKPRIIYLPSFSVPVPERIGELLAQAAPFHAWLADMAKAGVHIGAAGASVFHLATSGLLDGQECTVPSRLVPAFRQRFPAVRIRAAGPICVSGRIMTCSQDWHCGALVIRLFAETFTHSGARSLAMAEPPAGDTGFDTHEQDPVVARAKLLIRDRYTGDFRIADLARELGVTHQGLIRRFRAAGEKTPWKYVQHVRASSAASMLKDTRYRIAEIAHLVGYRDTASFRQTFTAIHGLSPEAWRRRQGNDP